MTSLIKDALAKATKFTVDWITIRYCTVVGNRLRKYGLRHDDLYDQSFDLDLQEALNRLPREVVDARNQRIKRAMDLSMKREYLPKELQMRVKFAACILFIYLLASVPSSAAVKKSSDVTELQIGVKHKPKSCDIQAHKGDRIKVHYRGSLTDGTVFDSSFERGDPIEFELGSGQVIKGWDQGILGMCVGEKRKLKIPSKLGYGDNGSPPKIPGGATLVFDTELVAVNGKPAKNSGDSEL